MTLTPLAISSGAVSAALASGSARNAAFTGPETLSAAYGVTSPSQIRASAGSFRGASIEADPSAAARRTCG
jgi:hypothetical protein